MREENTTLQYNCRKNFLRKTEVAVDKITFWKKVDKFGSACCRRTQETVDAVADLVKSQDHQPHSHLTIRQSSYELDIPRDLACIHDSIE